MSRWETDANIFTFTDEHHTSKAKSSNDCVSEKIGKLISEGYGQDQAAAIAISWCKEHTKSEHDCGCEDKTAPCGCKGKNYKASELWRKHLESAPILTKALDEDTQRFVDAVDSTFRSQVLDVAKRLRSAKQLDTTLVKDIEQILDRSRWRREVVEALAPFIRSAIDSGAIQGVSDLAKIDQDIPQTIRRDDLTAYAKSETVRLSRQIGDTVNTTTQVRIKDLMQNGIAEGLSTNDLADRIEQWSTSQEDGEDFNRNRALTIARTESARAMSLAKVKAWESTDLVSGKEWVLAPDACEFCTAAAKNFKGGQDISTPFFTKGDVLQLEDGSTMELDYSDVEAPPLHPNCRCDMVPVVIDQYKDLMDRMGRQSAERRAAWEESLNED